MSIRKFKKVEINTTKGKRYLVFRPVSKNLEDLACDSICPIGASKCMRLKDPTDPTNPERCFMDFCGGLGAGGSEVDEETRELKYYIPEKGTVEENLHDVDNFFEVLIKDNGYIRVHDLIDKACQDCPMYDKDHSQCSPENSLCLLQEVLKSANYDPDAEAKADEKAAETKSEEQDIFK